MSRFHGENPVPEEALGDSKELPDFESLDTEKEAKIMAALHEASDIYHVNRQDIFDAVVKGEKDHRSFLKPFMESTGRVAVMALLTKVLGPLPGSVVHEAGRRTGNWIGDRRNAKRQESLEESLSVPGKRKQWRDRLRQNIDEATARFSAHRRIQKLAQADIYLQLARGLAKDDKYEHAAEALRAVIVDWRETMGVMATAQTRRGPIMSKPLNALEYSVREYSLAAGRLEKLQEVEDDPA